MGAFDTEIDTNLPDGANVAKPSLRTTLKRFLGLDGSGYCRLGTATATARLHVSGDAGLTGADTLAMIRLEDTNATNARNWSIGPRVSRLDISDETAAAVRLSLDSSGVFRVNSGNLLQPGIGNTSLGINLSSAAGWITASVATGMAATLNTNADGTLVSMRRSGTAVGSISVSTTATTYNTSSDYRLKERVRNLGGEEAETLLRLMQPRMGGFIVAPEGPLRPMFLAHEYAAALPHAVTGDLDGEQYQTAAYDPATPILVAALTHALDRAAAAETALAAADARLDAIEAEAITTAATLATQAAAITALQAAVAALEAP